MIVVQDRRTIVVYEAKIGTRASYALVFDEIMDAIQARDDARIDASLADDARQARVSLQWRLLGYVWAVGMIWLLFFSR